jgi:tetratricopeptide (TPR) repeat protein
MKLFTTGEVAKILNLPGSRIRSFVRAGFLAPARDQKKTFQFTFQDLLFLKTAKGLLDSRVPSKRIIRMLSSLKRQMPDDQHLSGVKIYADGRRVVVWDGKARWQPDSGQFLFNFDARSVVPKVKLPLAVAKPTKDKLTADHWFNLGVELEATSTKEAQRAYHMALEIDPKVAAAHLNLGKLYHDAGELQKAEAHYRAAAEIDPEDPAPHFNLGVLMEDCKRPQEAMGAYREAIELDPSFADAHYNLALLFESMGKKAEAVAHFRTARKIYLSKYP